MSDVNAKVEAFFANKKQWQDELKALRAILLECPVTEEFKWRAPCYTFEGGNVATLSGLKDNCTLMFFKGVLLKDPEGILIAPGENSRSMRVIRFTSVADIAARADVLKDYIHEAIALEKAGLKVALRKDDLDLPDELIGKLQHDPALKTAFEALTPGRRRGYILHFSQPKQSKTRVSRIEKSIPRILHGKGMDDR